MKPQIRDGSAMNTQKNKVLILTSGGDAPGMNAAIRAAVRTAIANDFGFTAVNVAFKDSLNARSFHSVPIVLLTAFKKAAPF